MLNLTHPYLQGDGSADYKAELWKAMGVLSNYWTSKQRHALEMDLQLFGDQFDEAKYLQAACETAIASTLARMFPDSFAYEYQAKPPKDVDCSFKQNGFRFNFEIKCPDFSRKHSIDESGAFKIGVFGRFDDYFPLVEKLQNEVFNSNTNPNADSNRPLVKAQHMDNKLKDFLLSANGKFADDSSEEELNILVVCCPDLLSMQDWFFYMFGVGGLFTSDSYHSTLDYNNVDSVILTNMYHRHYDYQHKGKLNDHWDWRQSFNLIFPNPLRKKAKMAASWKVLELIPNYSIETRDFKLDHGFEELRIVYFVNEELFAKDKFLFQPEN